MVHLFLEIDNFETEIWAWKSHQYLKFELLGATPLTFKKQYKQ